MNLVERIKRFPSPLKDEETLLKTTMIIFLVLPVLYMIYLQMVTLFTKVDLKEILFNDVNASLNLIANFAGLYAAYAINIIRKDNDTKESMLGFYMILGSQILFMQPLTIMIMLVYVFRFIGFKKVFSDFRKRLWKKDYKILLPSLIVLVIAILVFAIRMRLFA